MNDVLEQEMCIQMIQEQQVFQTLDKMVKEAVEGLMGDLGFLQEYNIDLKNIMKSIDENFILFQEICSYKPTIIQLNPHGYNGLINEIDRFNTHKMGDKLIYKGMSVLLNSDLDDNEIKLSMSVITHEAKPWEYQIMDNKGSLIYCINVENRVNFEDVDLSPKI